MIAGAPKEALWFRPEPRLTWPLPLLEKMARTAFPHSRILACQPCTDGFRNANFKLRLDCSAEPMVLRIYEHDPSLCQKEVDLLRFAAAAVPVPEVIHAAPHGLEAPPFVLMRCVEGINFRELKRNGDPEAIAQAAYSTGQTLASIHNFTFAKPGWLGPGPRVTAPLMEGANPVPRFIDSCLNSPNLNLRMDAELKEALHTSIWSWASPLEQLDAVPCLVHGDFGKRNLLVRRVEEKWAVSAVLDWEFAVSGCGLADLGHLLRYERASRPCFEPYFSKGYVDAGGNLSKDWRSKARFLDLAALCESLTHEQLPDSATIELLELVRATIENREPNLL